MQRDGHRPARASRRLLLRGGDTLSAAGWARLVVTEGNYLLSPLPAWRAVRGLLDEVWYCALPDDERVRRLIARHERLGKAPEEARAWVATIDEPNAVAIEAWRDTADLVVDAIGLPPGRD